MNASTQVLGIADIHECHLVDFSYVRAVWGGLLAACAIGFTGMAVMIGMMLLITRRVDRLLSTLAKDVGHVKTPLVDGDLSDATEGGKA